MKDKFLQFVNSIKATVADIKTRANESIAALPPVEQHEAAGLILSMDRDLKWFISRVEDMATSDLVSKADEVIAAFQTQIINDAITAGTIIAKEAHEAQIESAREGGILAGRQEAILLAARRAEIDAAIGENHGIVFTDEQLTGEGYPAMLASVQSAVAKATENGFTLKGSPKGFTSIVAAALNGDQAVATIIATLSEVRGPAKPTEQSPAPSQPFVASEKPKGSESSFKFVSPFAK